VARPGPSAPRAAHESDLGAAHARFARVVMWVYLAAAAVAIVLFATALFTDLAHETRSAEATLSLENQVRAHYLGRHLELLAEELTRLGLRSEVDLLDENMEPERSLLRLTHEKSTFFDVGIAILSSDGTLLWSEPQTFQGAGAGQQGLLAALKRTHAVQIAPGRVEGEKASILYVAAPVLRNGQFTGALLGAVDLATGNTLEQGRGKGGDVRIALANSDGTLIYPPAASRDLSPQAGWKSLRGWGSPEAFVEEVPLAGRSSVVAGAPLQGTELTLLAIVPAQVLFGPARVRFASRLVFGLTLASVPLVVLVLLLRGSLRAFRQSEENAVRNDRLRALGEAVDSIAHEVKNSLNGLRVGLDLIVRGEGAGIEARHRQAVSGLRTEIERLANFTTELLSFSKGVVPRPVSLDLAEFVGKVSDLARSEAESRGVQLDITTCGRVLRVKADPALIHVAVANLVSNALDFAGGGTSEAPWVRVHVDARGGSAGVSVTDNGPGVSATVLPRLFEPFASGKPNGVGIGLALSRRIARAHGGDLVLERSAEGAAFRLDLPLEVK
jgi:signal transduction histidine kinase